MTHHLPSTFVTITLRSPIHTCLVPRQMLRMPATDEEECDERGGLLRWFPRNVSSLPPCRPSLPHSTSSKRIPHPPSPTSTVSFRKWLDSGALSLLLTPQPPLSAPLRFFPQKAAASKLNSLCLHGSGPILSLYILMHALQFVTLCDPSRSSDTLQLVFEAFASVFKFS